MWVTTRKLHLRKEMTMKKFLMILMALAFVSSTVVLAGCPTTADDDDSAADDDDSAM